MIRKIIAGVGLFLFFVVWGTVAVQLAVNPGPWNNMTFVEGGEEFAPHGLDCNEVMLIESDSLYSICHDSKTKFTGWTRLSPDSGEITPLVEIPGSVNFGTSALTRLRLLAENDNGDWVMLLWILDRHIAGDNRSNGNMFAIVPRDGNVEYFPVPEPTIFISGQGIAWDGEDVEVVTADEVIGSDLSATIYHYDRQESWQEGRQIEVPEVCPSGCRLSHAYFEDGLWHFLVWSGDVHEYDLVSVVDEDGNIEPIAITERGSFDTAHGNKIPLQFSTYDQLYLYEDEWLAIPFTSILDEYNVPIYTTVNWFTLKDSRLQLYPNGLQVIVSTEEGYDESFEHRSWFRLDDRWIEVAQQNGQIAMREAGSDEFDPVVSNPMPVVRSSIFPPFARIVLLKNNLGGYWLVTGYGQYVALDEDFERTDSLSIPSRFAALFDHFALYEQRGWSGFFAENDTLKQVLFVLLLISYPLAGLGAFLVRRGWLLAGFIGGIVYVLIFASGIVWFWQMIVYL